MDSKPHGALLSLEQFQSSPVVQICLNRPRQLNVFGSKTACRSKTAWTPWRTRDQGEGQAASQLEDDAGEAEGEAEAVAEANPTTVILLQYHRSIKKTRNNNTHRKTQTTFAGFGAWTSGKKLLSSARKNVSLTSRSNPATALTMLSDTYLRDKAFDLKSGTHVSRQHDSHKKQTQRWRNSRDLLSVHYECHIMPLHVASLYHPRLTLSLKLHPLAHMACSIINALT